MDRYLDIFWNGYKNYAAYLWQEITNPSWHNYFYWLIGVSLLFFFLEVLIPWRKQQSVFRKDFWLDAFYMFFNFFLFSLIVYNAASDVVVNLFNDGIKSVTGFDLQASNPLRYWPIGLVLLTGFIVRDFVQWWVHRLLHRIEWLWRFHKVHHSVQEMGFAAHLRYHWMENIVYRTIEYLPLALLGIGLYDFFIIHIFTLMWGHYNHANIRISKRIPAAVVGGLIGLLLFWETSGNILTIGVMVGCVSGAEWFHKVLPLIFNSPEMHIWHHAKAMPPSHRYGINFGLTLAIWDYLFGTAHIPADGKDIALGFDDIDSFPEGFVKQNLYGL